MQEKLLDIPFPTQGLNVATAYADQPKLTTRSATNVRAYDPRYGRDRGAQRAGLSKYVSLKINEVRTGTLQAGSTSTTAVLDAGASGSNNTYNGQTITITGGTGSGQTQLITAYVGATKTVAVAGWTITPDATSTFSIAWPIQDVSVIVYTAAGQALSPRVIRGVAVAGGTVKRYAAPSTVSAVTAGAGALSATATVVFSDQLGQKLFFADGVNWKYYDAATDAIVAITPSAGSLPVDSGGNAPRLQTVWRNRLMYGGLPLDPYNYFASAMGDATNWAYNPSPALETEAFAGNVHTAGLLPDILTCFIPYNDELLIMGADSSLWQMTGDPMAGGRIDLISDGVGMAWGRPYCRDGFGDLYFVSSRGSVYQHIPGGEPKRLSDPIAELLLTANLGSKIVRMAWDERQFGFHVWITTIAAPAADTHYFFDTRTGAWWQDQFANNAFNPLAARVFDGDGSGDRAILLGSWDGYLRKVDQAALDDDGVAINSTVLMGPTGNANGATMIDLQGSLDTNSASVNYLIMAGRDAQSATASTSTAGTLALGRNRSQAMRVFGHAHYVQLASLNVPGSAWSLEYLRGRFLLAEGNARQRIW